MPVGNVQEGNGMFSQPLNFQIKDSSLINTQQWQKVIKKDEESPEKE